MRGYCKKCGWPWHVWGHDSEPTHCDKCFEDPTTEHRPLVLFDEIGRPEGCGKNLRVQLKKGCDPDRLQSGIREWVSIEKVEHASFAFPRSVTLIDHGVHGKARKDLEVDRGGERRIVVLCGDKSGSQIFEEDEFLDLFEPVRYERFWREGEDYEPVLKPGHYPRVYPEIQKIELRVESTEIVPRERKLVGKVFLLEHQYKTNNGRVYPRKVMVDAMKDHNERERRKKEFDQVMFINGYFCNQDSWRDAGERRLWDYVPASVQYQRVTVEFIGCVPVRFYERDDEDNVSPVCQALVAVWEEHERLYKPKGCGMRNLFKVVGEYAQLEHNRREEIVGVFTSFKLPMIRCTNKKLPS